MSRLSEWRGFWTGLALVASGFLVCAYVNLDIPGQPLLESLRLHLAGLVLVLAIVLIATRAFWRGGLFVLLALASAGQDVLLITNMQAARPEETELAGLPAISWLHFNILNSNGENGDAISQMVVASHADVATILEAGPVAPFRERLFASYPYHAGCEEENRCDLLLLSRFPLTNVQVRSLSNFSPRRLITAEAEIDGRQVNLVAVHLTKPYFDGAAIGETWALARIVRGLEGPLIMAGDFNAAAWSDNLQRVIRAGQLLTGPDLPSTWPTFLGAFGVPIDNIFSREPAIITELDALPDPMGSNHRGLRATITLMPQ